MFRNFVCAVGLVGAFWYASSVHALGLGDVQLKSGLNEPLHAEIKLLNTGDLNASQIIIKLASAEDFARAGAERNFFLTNFKYDTHLDGKGGGVVKVTTKELVREPYLNFLLEAKWPSGKLVREYTLLVDLPVFKSTNDAPHVAAAPAQSTAAAQTVSRQPARRTSARKPTPAFTSRERAPVKATEQGDTITTRRNDTLWNLALEVRPTPAVSPQKVMVAMQALNPHAFINNNINLLKTGAVMRIPSMEEITRIDNDRALAAVEKQNQRWRSMSTGERQLDATPARSEPETMLADESEDTGRLRLTTSSSDDATASGGTDDQAKGDGLAAKLLAAEEAVEAANAENIELRTKVDDLEAELIELKNKLQISDTALANLQKAETAAAVAEAAQEEAKADVAATKTVAEQTLAEPDPTTPPAAVESPGLLDRILDNPLYVGGLGALALALLGGVFFARRRSAADEGFDVMAEVEAEAEAPLEDAAEQMEPLTATDDEVAEQPQDFSEFELDSLDNEEAVESEIGDPVAEADIYMAYGRFPQAVELLNRALEQEPERTDLRVKLVEVHMGAGSTEAAEEQLALLQNSGDAEALQQAQQFLGQDSETQDGAIEQPELMDEFAQMLGENDAVEQAAPASQDDSALADAANDEIPGGLALADEAELGSDDLSLGVAPEADDGFDLELDLDDAVVDTENAELADLDIDMAAEEGELNIESELSELSADLGIGDNEIAPAESADTIQFEPDLDLNVSDEEIAALENTLADQPEADESHAELDLINATDETATKIDLARAYIDMGDTEGAKDILNEVLGEAENEQLQEAQELLDRIA